MFALPVTVEVADNGSVTIDHPNGIVGMSRFSERAQRLAAGLGAGTHSVATPTEIAHLSDDVLRDLNDAITY